MVAMNDIANMQMAVPSLSELVGGRLRSLITKQSPAISKANPTPPIGNMIGPMKML
jgi:hypothetical protein